MVRFVPWRGMTRLECGGRGVVGLVCEERGVVVLVYKGCGKDGVLRVCDVAVGSRECCRRGCLCGDRSAAVWLSSTFSFSFLSFSFLTSSPLHCSHYGTESPSVACSGQFWSSYFLLLLLLPLSSLPLSRLLLLFFLLLFLLLRLLLLSLLLHLSLPAQWCSSRLCRGSVKTEPGCLSGVCQLKPFKQASSLLSQSIWGYSNRHSHLTTVVMSQ